MGIPVFILGPSGAGKSASLRNFEADEIGIFNVANKPLPFRKKLPVANTASYDAIMAALKKGGRKTYVIDDSQYLLAFELFDRVDEKGYDKFTQMAVKFQRLIRFIQTQTSPDTIAYFLHHTEMGGDNMIKAKTIGKMLDEKLTLEGLFSIVLMARAEQDRHIFLTQGQGISTAKSPMDMFPELEMDNDLKAVDDAIRAYYELAPRTAQQPTEEKAA